MSDQDSVCVAKAVATEKRVAVPVVLRWGSREVPCVDTNESFKSLKAFLESNDYRIESCSDIAVTGEKGVETFNALLMLRPAEDGFVASPLVRGVDEVEEILKSKEASPKDAAKDEAAEQLVMLMADHLSSKNKGIRAAAYQGLMSLQEHGLKALPKVMEVLREGADPEDPDAGEKVAQALTLAGYLMRIKEGASRPY